MAKLSIAGNVKMMGLTTSGKTYLKVWDKFDDYKGQERSRIITVWFERDLLGEVREGDFVEITGELGGKIEEYESRVTGQTEKAIAYSINKPTLVQVKLQAESKTAETARLNENIETPF
jgi:DNA replicative helicase MCM subunit Mcm2 (Cdc46/Mcm family)